MSFRKVWRDLWNNQGRTLLVVLSIAVGVLAVGMSAWAVRYGLFSIGSPFALVLLVVALHGVCFDFFLAAGFIHTDNKAPAEKIDTTK